MTEPTQAQIEEAKQMRARYPSRVSLDVYTNELASTIALAAWCWLRKRGA